MNKIRLRDLLSLKQRLKECIKILDMVRTKISAKDWLKWAIISNKWSSKSIALNVLMLTSPKKWITTQDCSTREMRQSLFLKRKRQRVRRRCLRKEKSSEHVIMKERNNSLTTIGTQTTEIKPINLVNQLGLIQFHTEQQEGKTLALMNSLIKLQRGLIRQCIDWVKSSFREIWISESWIRILSTNVNSQRTGRNHISQMVTKAPAE